MQDGRVFFGIINGPFLCDASGTGSNFRTGLTFAVERGWIKRHESCTHVRLTGLRPELGLYYLSSANQALSLSVASLEPIASFSPIGWAKSITDEH